METISCLLICKLSFTLEKSTFSFEAEKLRQYGCHINTLWCQVQVFNLDLIQHKSSCLYVFLVFDIP